MSIKYSWDFVFLSYEKTLCLIIHNSMCWFAMTDASVWDDIVHNNWEKRSWIEGEFLFLLCNKSLAQTRFIHFVSVTVFTAPWHKPSKGLYKRLKISLKVIRGATAHHIYVFDAECKWAVHLFVFLTRWELNETVWTRSCVLSVSPLPPPLRAPTFLAFFKTVVRTNQCWNGGFHDL